MLIKEETAFAGMLAIAGVSFLLVLLPFRIWFRRALRRKLDAGPSVSKAWRVLDAFRPLILTLLSIASVVLPLILLGAARDYCLVVREGGAGVEKVLYTVFGSPRLGLGNGQVVTLRQSAIVNDTPRPLRYSELYYGFGTSKEESIPPWGVRWGVTTLHHFGPNDPPPRAVESKQYLECRIWLTWDAQN